MVKEEAILFITIALLGFIVCRIPFLGNFFKVLNTLFHEGGHALAAWITNGEVLRIDLFYNTTGTTITKSNNKIGQIIVSLSGYIFASFIPYIFIIFLSKGYIFLLHISFLSLSIFLLILAIRNIFGIIWILLILFIYILILFLKPDYAWIIVYLYTGILLFEGLFSAIEQFYLAVKKPSMAGDATNLNRFTGSPVWFWGFVFLAQAFLFFYLSVKMLF